MIISVPSSSAAIKARAMENELPLAHSAHPTAGKRSSGLNRMLKKTEEAPAIKAKWGIRAISLILQAEVDSPSG